MSARYGEGVDLDEDPRWSSMDNLLVVEGAVVVAKVEGGEREEDGEDERGGMMTDGDEVEVGEVAGGVADSEEEDRLRRRSMGSLRRRSAEAKEVDSEEVGVVGVGVGVVGRDSEDVETGGGDGGDGDGLGFGFGGLGWVEG